MNQNLKYRKFPSFILRMKMSKDGRTDGNDKLMLCMLFNLEETGKAYKQRELSMMLGMSETTVSHSIKRLEALGFVNVVEGKFDPSTKTKTQNTYSLNWSKLEEYITDNDYFTINAEVEKTTVAPKQQETPKTVVPTPQPIAKTATPPAEEDDEDTGFNRPDPIKNPELSFLYDEQEMEEFRNKHRENKPIEPQNNNHSKEEYQQEIINLIPTLRLNDGSINYEAMRKVVPELSIKYNISKGFVDEDIKTVLNKVA